MAENLITARVTMRDVAKASGVSQSTVSFVLNGRGEHSIADATRARVMRTAQELGYAPHGIARALREGTSRIVVLKIGEGLESNYVRGYIRGLDQELDANGHVLLVRYGDVTEASDRQVLDAIAPRAVLQFGAAYLHGADLDEYGGGAEDGLAAHTEMQLRYLLDRGHRSVALAAWDCDDRIGAVRHRFATRAAESLGLDESPSIALSRDRQAAARTVGRFLRDNPEVTAFAAVSDDVAIAAIAGLQDAGLRLPDQMAVIGYDDVGYGARITPPLTSIAIDGEGHGRRAARRALGLGLEALSVALVPARILERGSA